MNYVQQEFDFGGLEEEAEKPRKPALPRFDNPKCDNERLLNLQWAYKEKGDKNAISSMYGLGLKVALKYINTKARKNRHVAALCGSDREEKAHNAITYIIEQYIRRPDFAIAESFTAYLYLRVQHELFYTRKVDRIVSFVDMEKFYREGAGNDR